MDVLFKVESNEIFTQELEEILDNLYDLNQIESNKILDTLNIKAAKEDIKNIILDTNLNTNEVSELLYSKFNDNDKVRIFISLLEKKKLELLNSTIIHFNCTFGETLNNFDWKLKLVCGTSDLKTLSYPLLQVVFSTVTSSHKSRLRLHEFNKDMLLRMIGTLEEYVGDKVKNDIDKEVMGDIDK